MSERLPNEFRSDEEMAEWFEHADLSQYNLDQALDVVVATTVKLSIEDSLEPGQSTAGAVVDTKLEISN